MDIFEIDFFKFCKQKAKNLDLSKMSLTLDKNTACLI